MSKLTDFSKLCIHTLTTKPWDLRQCVENYSAAGIHGISIWRNVLENQNLKEVRKLLQDNNMTAVSLIRNGFFPSIDIRTKEQALNDNL